MKMPATTKKAVTGTPNSADSTDLTIVTQNNEPRVDSRLLAQRLGIKHHSLFAQAKTYKADFKEFGKVLFQTEPLPSGQLEKFALLNEDQAHLLLTYSRNTAKVRSLKIKLVKAFGMARRATQVRQTEYLPAYHEMQDRIHTIADGAPNERFMHINIAKLVNKVAGIKAGQRPGAPLPKQSLLAVAHMLAASAISDKEIDRHQAYGRIKAALEPLNALASPNMGVLQ
jgi:phage regulator Rha-like protein